MNWGRRTKRAFVCVYRLQDLIGFTCVRHGAWSWHATTHLDQRFATPVVYAHVVDARSDNERFEFPHRGAEQKL